MTKYNDISLEEAMNALRKDIQHWQSWDRDDPDNWQAMEDMFGILEDYIHEMVDCIRFN